MREIKTLKKPRTIMCIYISTNIYYSSSMTTARIHNLKDCHRGHVQVWASNLRWWSYSSLMFVSLWVTRQLSTPPICNIVLLTGLFWWSTRDWKNTGIRFAFSKSLKSRDKNNKWQIQINEFKRQVWIGLHLSTGWALGNVYKSRPEKLSHMFITSIIQ